MASPQSIHCASGACMHTWSCRSGRVCLHGLAPKPKLVCRVGGGGQPWMQPSVFAGHACQQGGTHCDPSIQAAFGRHFIWRALQPPESGVARVYPGQVWGRHLTESECSQPFILTLAGWGRCTQGGLQGCLRASRAPLALPAGGWESRDPHAVLPRSLSTFDFLVMLWPVRCQQFVGVLWSASGAANAPITHRFVFVVSFVWC